MTFDNEAHVLELARDWKAGKLTPVHPSVGRVLNRALTHGGEDAVPFARNTVSSAPSIVDLIRGEHERAPGGGKSLLTPSTRRFLDQMSASVHGRSHDS